ncbi:MAG: hypothetical protein PWQ27_1242 [Kosmotoga sp.]|nr:hypothetical protein [Kosmotoga sp.]MDK2953859.1 hypothetical protein [Kosmotoga sp.]
MVIRKSHFLSSEETESKEKGTRNTRTTRSKMLRGVAKGRLMSRRDSTGLIHQLRFTVTTPTKNKNRLAIELKTVKSFKILFSGLIEPI